MSVEGRKRRKDQPTQVRRDAVNDAIPEKPSMVKEIGKARKKGQRAK